MATHSNTLAWKIPWMEEPGRLQSMRSLRVGYDWETSLSLFTFMHWRRKWQPTPVFFLENPRDGGAWWAAVYGVTQSRTRLKWLRGRTLGKHVYSLVCNSGNLYTILFQDIQGPVQSPTTASQNLGPATQFWGVNMIQESLVLRYRQWHRKLSSIKLTSLTCFHSTLLKCW